MENNRYDLDHNITLIEIDEDVANSCGNYVINVQTFDSDGSLNKNRYFMLNGISVADMFEICKTKYSFAYNIYSTIRDFFTHNLQDEYYAVINCAPFKSFLISFYIGKIIEGDDINNV